jgi:hypothetical protein
MQKRMSSRVPAVAAGLLVVTFALDPAELFAASDCLDQPSPAAIQTGHWRYHLDRASGRKCWHMTESETAARPPQPEASPPPAPEPVREPSFASFFSSLTSGFTTASVGAPQPDAPSRNTRSMASVQPEAGKGDDSARKRRQRADDKPAPAPKLDRQASSRPAKEGADQPRPVSLEQADRDRLFQEFLRWRERQ